MIRTQQNLRFYLSEDLKRYGGKAPRGRIGFFTTNRGISIGWCAISVI